MGQAWGHGRSRECQDSGPRPPEDHASEKIWSLSTGKLIDECEIDFTADSTPHREMDHVDGIRVELILKNATQLFERKGPDIVEIFSQLRLCQEVAGRSFGGTTLNQAPAPI